MNTESPKSNSDADTEADIWNAISAFERILEVMPDDRMSLDTLVHAYIQLGDHARALTYMVRLAKVVADEGDGEAAVALLEQMGPYEADPALQSQADRLRILVEGKGQLTPEKKETPGPLALKSLLTHKVNITEELSLAWDLLQAAELTKEQYAEVVQDLTNISSNAADLSGVAMLHVIENRGFGNIERILVFASQKADLPLISLAGFDFGDEAISLLPMEVMLRQGVLPFDLLGPDALVVIQNPYDLELRKHVELGLGRRCHFYLSSPSEFSSSIVRVEKRRAEMAARAVSAK